MIKYLPSLACTILVLCAAANADTSAATIAPTTPNPGLHYYYPVPKPEEPQTLRVDVCVYGGTPGGVGAAVQARRMGKTSALAVFRRHVGGMTSAGLTAVDLGRKESIGGMAAESVSNPRRPEKRVAARHLAGTAGRPWLGRQMDSGLQFPDVAHDRRGRGRISEACGIQW